MQDTVYTLTGTGLLPYIRPVYEEWFPLASMKSARIVLINLAAFSSLWASQVFNTLVLPVVSSMFTLSSQSSAGYLYPSNALIRLCYARFRAIRGLMAQ